MVALAVATGCSSLTFPTVTANYYMSGPESGLTVLDIFPVADRDAPLAAMEESMMRLELGQYRESRDVALRGLKWVDGGPGAPRDLFTGESFERVWLATVAMLDSLARQETEPAAEDAERVLKRIRSSGCEACGFAFSRWVAALALADAGRLEEARGALADALHAAPGRTVLLPELARLGGLPGLSEGFQVLPGPDLESLAAPRPRELVVLLLLGAGPDKVVAGEDGSNAASPPRVRFVASADSSAASGVVVIGNSEVHPAVVLTDMAELAETSLEARPSGGGSEDQDLRHWSTLPATCQVARVVLSEATPSVALALVDRDGVMVWYEDLELPPQWGAGPLFVVRRQP